MSVKTLISLIKSRCDSVRTAIDVGVEDYALSRTFRDEIGGFWLTVLAETATSQNDGILAPDTVFRAGKDWSLPFEDNQFDVAVLDASAFNMDSVKEIHRILNPGGKLIFEVPERLGDQNGFTARDIYHDFLKYGFDVETIKRPSLWFLRRKNRTLTVCARKKSWKERPNLTKNGAMAAIGPLAYSLLLIFMLTASVFGSGDAVVTLLNSRASGSAKNFAEAVEKVAIEAEKGRPLHCYILALVSRDEFVPEKGRLTDAVRNEYLEKNRPKIQHLAQTTGNPLAWYLLALEKNDLKLLKKASDGGNVQALNAWGTYILNDALRNPGVDTNKVASILESSFNCFKSAVDQQDPNGYYNLGMCFMHGYGCERSEEKAFNYFRVAAGAGHPEAINNLGAFYLEGRVVGQDSAMAVKWFKKSCEMGNDYGKFNYAKMLLEGEGIEKDEKSAAILLKECALRGLAEAMNAYGMCCFKGTGTEKNVREAVKWYRISASKMFPPAMDNLSVCYEMGYGVAKDSKASTVWKVRGRAARGDRHAAAWLSVNDKGDVE